ncbi:MAG: PD-(D/E)XK nuclease family protein [Smithellaceae bacterium]|nr:PD-(D/E)XK nuclease family protein [Smithellaceae bacterium]
MLIEQILAHYNREEKDREWANPLRGSNAGKCQRAMAYQLHGFPALPLRARARLVFRLGDLIEKDLTEIAVLYGLTRMQEEVSVEIAGQRITGHIDGVINETVVDFKSCTTYRVKEARRGQVAYNEQMQFYMKATGLQTALVVYYVKEDSELYEQLIHFDPQVWEQIEARFTRVMQSTPENLPDREYGPDEKGRLRYPCSYCNWVNLCHEGYDLSFDGKGKPQLICHANS